MKTFNNEIIIHQGESFTIDKYIENIDGSPYIISNQLGDPYFLLTVSTSKYAQTDRYVKKYWLSLRDFPRFYLTKPVDLKSIKTAANSAQLKYNDFPTDGSSLAGYIDGKYVVFETNDAVFYLVDATGRKVYKYWNAAANEWVTYRCRLIVPFSSQDTESWTAQSYVYSIRLVAKGDASSTVCNIVDILPPTKLSVLPSI